MIFSRKKKPIRESPPPLTRDQALNGIPKINPVVTVHILEDGLVQLEYPLALRPFFIQLFERFNKNKEKDLIKKLELDQLGSEVWLLIDGERDVRKIIQLFAINNDISLQEAESASTTFLRQLGNRKIIAIG